MPNRPFTINFDVLSREALFGINPQVQGTIPNPPAPPMTREQARNGYNQTRQTIYNEYVVDNNEFRYQERMRLAEREYARRLEVINAYENRRIDPTTLSVIASERPENRHSRLDPSERYIFRTPTEKMKVDHPVFSLGWELEANKKARIVPEGLDQHSDVSVNGDAKEYVCMPSVTKSPKYVLNLLKDLVHSPGLNTNKSCGFHVHMSLQKLSENALRKWAVCTQMVASKIEPFVWSAVPESRKRNNYCRPITLLQSGHIFVPNKYNNDLRYQWLNIVEMFRPNGIRTIEVRLLGHTHRWKYLLSWVTFCLMLGQEGLRIAQQSRIATAKSVKSLQKFLKMIETEIKPLEKKSNPVPEIVYQKLAELGIKPETFDRPLKGLVERENKLFRRQFWYSDEQEIEENEELCNCGCGESDRCGEGVHNDGDCDSSECEYCHSEGNCNDSCYYHRQEAHRDGESCGQRYCTRCYRSRQTQNANQTNGGSR